MYAATVVEGTGSRKIAIVGNMGSPDTDSATITGGELNLISGGAYGTQTGTNFKMSTQPIVHFSEKFDLASTTTSKNKW